MTISTLKQSLTTDEVAKLRGVRRETVIASIRRGVRVGGKAIRLRATRWGQSWMIDPADLEQFAREMTEAALADERPAAGTTLAPA